EIAGRLAVRDGAAFEDEPALRAMGVSKLVEQARLANTRLADDRDHLTSPVTRELEGTAKLFYLGVASDEPREAASSGGLKARPRRPRTGQLIDLGPLAEPFDGHRPKRRDLHVPFGQADSVRR